jgi:hypothetical protein
LLASEILPIAQNEIRVTTQGSWRKENLKFEISNSSSCLAPCTLRFAPRIHVTLSGAKVSTIIYSLPDQGFQNEKKIKNHLRY